VSGEPIWRPRRLQRAASNLSVFAHWLADTGQLGVEVDDYETLWRWSVGNREAFWQSIWKFADVRASREATQILADDAMPGAKWFVGARLNFAENLLRFRDERPAIIACDESGRRVETSYAELRDAVTRVAAALRSDGVVAGDRVAAYMPNCTETLVAMLATASIGAGWSSCSPDFGIAGAAERFGQIEPKVLFACDGYRYDGKSIDTTQRVRELHAQLPSVRRVVLVPFLRDAGDLQALPGVTLFGDYGARDGGDVPLAFEQLPFDHPLYILFSSGTTGKPKCIVHGAGATLLQHYKELALHADLKTGDRLLFFTTCGWMMWNWMASGLAIGATLVLYDGSPFHPGPEVLWQIAEREKLTHFGTSPKYLSALQKSHYVPKKAHPLERLRIMLSTGSPLAPDQYDFVYTAIKRDLWLCSISGGTDILSCFGIGNPWAPVWRGEIQCRGLGMAVDVFDESGRPLRGAPGELVCTKAFPSMPLGFWNDPDGRRYRAAYFERFPGVWHHGDYCEITRRGTLLISGRSDATLNPGGVRIGTAEIYRVVDVLPEILESVAVAHRHDNDDRVVLFVRLRDGAAWSAELESRIKSAVRAELSPRHVPAKVLPCPEVPRTMSGKITEISVRELIHGRPVKNTEALANPGSLEYFRNLRSEELL
jgi:acetoacetyl-CoA synthetase